MNECDTMPSKNRTDKTARGTASQFFVAGELCRRGLYAVVTLGNTPNTDILCSNRSGTKFVHIQVKTFVPGGKTCSVGQKAEKFYSTNFFWILAGIPHTNSHENFTYYIIPSLDMSRNVTDDHQVWLNIPGKNGRPHQDNPMRSVAIPPRINRNGWDISKYNGQWHLIEACLAE